MSSKVFLLTLTVLGIAKGVNKDESGLEISPLYLKTPGGVGISYKGPYSLPFTSSPGGNNGFSPAENQLPLWAAKTLALGKPVRATTLHGVPVPSLTATQAIGTRGNPLLQDYNVIDKLGQFARERIPERVVHAKGAGAHGYFLVTHDISKFTRAKFLNGIGKKTPIFVRFSTVAGELGTADTLVDPHGFAIKFYTEEGNHDIVGLNIEAFPIRDPILFSDLNKSRKRNPVTNMWDLNTWFDFTSLRPESTFQLLQLHSDMGRPDGYRRADGFGIHAFKCVNALGQVIFCKFHWRSLQRAPALTHEEATALAGNNTEYLTQDLYDSIAKGNFPAWGLFLQVMTVDQIKLYPRNPFDTTRTWREEEFPLIPIGKFILDKNPSNYFAEVEQVAFLPSNMVPGIEPSPDRLLAARLFSYQDAQRYRITTNGAQLPINRPIVPITSYNRNGLACQTDNGGSSPNYFPNSFGGLQQDVIGAGHATFLVEGIVDRFDIPEDEYIEPRIFLERDVDPFPGARHRLVSALAVRIYNIQEEVRERLYANNIRPVSKSLEAEVRAAVAHYQATGGT